MYGLECRPFFGAVKEGRGGSVKMWADMERKTEGRTKKLIIFIIAQKFILFARAVNIFDSDFQMAKSPGTAPLPLLLLGISNDFGSFRSLLNVYALLNLISLLCAAISFSLSARCLTELTKCRPTFVAMIYVP